MDHMDWDQQQHLRRTTYLGMDKVYYQHIFYKWNKKNGSSKEGLKMTISSLDLLSVLSQEERRTGDTVRRRHPHLGEDD